MITDRDIAKLKAVFVTKEDLKMEFLELKAELLENFVTRDEFYTRFDAVMVEIKAMREDMAAFVYRSQQHDLKLEAHDRRLQAMEASPT